MKQILQRAASDWLVLRRPADEAARESTFIALEAISAHLARQLTEGHAAHIIDLGAGTGANLAFLAPRLGVLQRWTLIERDEDLLGEVPSTASSQVVDIRRLARDLERLEDIMGDDDATLVTCTAVLDVLTEDQVRSLATLLVQRGVAVLFSLSVTGEVHLQPCLELDARIASAFNAHQRRRGLAGPRATAIAGEIFAA
ncbi:MAG: class I SAM-dependent methyltransferase, partial [Arachnia sp.]